MTTADGPCLRGIQRGAHSSLNQSWVQGAFAERNPRLRLGGALQNFPRNRPLPREQAGLADGAKDFGSIVSTASHLPGCNWLDSIYFLFVTYTTVGYGDLVPVGPIRFIAATEALNGWVLLGWSASFTFLEMQRFWRGPRA